MKKSSHRQRLKNAGLLGMTLAFTLSALTPAAAEQPQAGQTDSDTKLKIVVTGGHPGDPEYGCGGTIAHYTDLGHDVVLLYLNKGEGSKSTEGDPAVDRVAEFTKACEILKARPVFGGQIDGQSIVDREHYDAFRKLLQAEKPDVVFTHWPIDNHADHRAMSMLVYGAWQKMGKKFALYYYEVSNGEDTLQFSPTHYVDITGTTDRKREACYAHASQSPDKFYALQEMVTKLRGVEAGCQQAEGFIRQIQSPGFALPMAR